jgi:hypothetical protein
VAGGIAPASRARPAAITLTGNAAVPNHYCNIRSMANAVRWFKVR